MPANQLLWVRFMTEKWLNRDLQDFLRADLQDWDG